MDSEIKKEYKLFLKDTNKKENAKSWNEFKKDYITWFVDMFGISDERTKNIIDELNTL